MSSHEHQLDRKRGIMYQKIVGWLSEDYFAVASINTDPSSVRAIVNVMSYAPIRIVQVVLL